MNWLASLFTSDNSQRKRKGQIFSSTHEAFSLPTSPVFPTHPDAFNPDALNTPDPQSARSPAQYTYPPQGLSAYGYVPSSSGLNSRVASSSLLPTHMDSARTPFSSHPHYPPLSQTWARIRNWLTREYPELGDTLNYGILPQDLADIELQFGFSLPPVIRESYLCVDGQEAESAAGCSDGLFFGLTLLPLETVLQEWTFWREVDNDPQTGLNADLRENMRSIPPGWVRKDYSQRGWIPLIADKAGNYVGVDLNPAESGSVGQVIVFGRDFDTKVVLWKGDGLSGWAKWLASFAEELEQGEGFEIGGADGSDGSEDDLGYESYYYDGSGRGQGDGGRDGGIAGGLHYTGEYRGWNVLEAWADRSFRRWHAAGLIPQEEPQLTQKADALQVDPTDVTRQGSDVEVPIPVSDSASNVATTSQASKSKSKAPKTHAPIKVPTIAVSKPPAPRPVGLPTPMDIAPLPSPPGSANSSFDDLESGQLREPYEDVGLVSSTRRTGKSKSPSRRDTTDLSESAIPMSPPPPISPPTPRALLIQPSSPVQPPRQLLIDSTSEPIDLSDKQPALQRSSPTETPVALISDAAELNGEPEQSIRLIGGGGQAGKVDELVSLSTEDETQPESKAESADASSIVSSDGDKKVHKKSKGSFVNLKRFSNHLGTIGKQGSSSSTKDSANSTTK